MNALPPFYDLSAAGSMAASVCSRGAQDGAPAAPPPFASDSRAPCAALPTVACKISRLRRLAGALFDLVSGPRLERAR